MPTKQETFDTVVRGILGQGRQSADQGECVYRRKLPDGTVLKCAAGMLIPDDQYRLEFEGTVVSSFDHPNRPVNAIFNRLGYDRSLVSDLQDAHDVSSEPASFCHDFIQQARRTAERHGLSTDVLDEVSV